MSVKTACMTFCLERSFPSTANIIQSDVNGMVKIGFTSRPVEQRLRELQTGSPVPLRLLATLPGKQSIERELHKRFEAHHVSGEWFKPHPSIMEFIAALNG